MERELERIASFSNWTGSHSPIMLAKEGFYSVGGRSPDEIQCYSCKLSLNNLESVERLEETHSRLSPNCQFVNPGSKGAIENERLNSGGLTFECILQGIENTSLFSSSGKKKRANTAGLSEPSDVACAGDSHDTVNLNLMESDGINASPRPQSRTEPSETAGHVSLLNTGSKGIVADKAPMSLMPPVQRNSSSAGAFPKSANPIARDGSRPGLSSSSRTNNSNNARLDDNLAQSNFALMKAESKRFESFHNFPSTKQAPRQLAAAGFYYMGLADRTQCAFCKGILRNWEATDVPMEEHRKHFGHCPFVRGQPCGNVSIYEEQTQLEATLANQSINSARQSQIPRDTQLKAHNPLTTSSLSADSAVPSPTPPGEGVVHRYDRREVKARMDTPMTRLVMNMGYPRDVIRIVIEERLRNTGDDFESAESMLEAIFAVEERLNKEKHQHQQQHQQNQQIQQQQRQQALSSQQQKENQAADKREHDSSNTVPSDGKAKRKGGKKKKKHPSGGPAKPTVNEHPQSNDVVQGDTQLASLADADLLSCQQLKVENEQMKEQRICKVCMVEEIKIVFLPCAHLVTCDKCAPKVTHCPVCRAYIKGTIKTFIP